MKYITLSNTDLKAIVDDEDYDMLSTKKWSLNRRGYPQAVSGVRMHLMVIDVPEGMQGDHINRNKLDNRKTNLRVATASQNQANRRMPKTNTSGYKGVRWDRGKWRAYIGVDGKDRHLGRFVNITDAAKAYDVAALAVFGDFALVNGVL